MVRPLKHLWKQWTDFNEHWHVAVGNQAHHSLFKPRVDLELFNNTVKFCNFGFYIGNVTKMDLLEISAACDLEIKLKI